MVRNIRNALKFDVVTDPRQDKKTFTPFAFASCSSTHLGTCLDPKARNLRRMVGRKPEHPMQLHIKEHPLFVDHENHSGVA